jgi:hypothetical protein
LDIQTKLNKMKKAIHDKQRIKMKNTNFEYIPVALRLTHNSFAGWLYSVECIEERTNSVIHIKLIDIEEC